MQEYQNCIYASIPLIILSPLQAEVIIGNILGDAYISRKKQSFNPIIAIEQTYPKREDYVMHLYNIYKTLTLSEPKVIVRKLDIRTNKVYGSIRFRTISLACLVPIYEMFYIDDHNGNKRKIIPRDIDKYLTARSLAY